MRDFDHHEVESHAVQRRPGFNAKVAEVFAKGAKNFCMRSFAPTCASSALKFLRIINDAKQCRVAPKRDLDLDNPNCNEGRDFQDVATQN